MNELKIENSSIGKVESHPSNIEAEQALIGSILVNNDIIDEVSNIISHKDFYDPLHSKIYSLLVLEHTQVRECPEFFRQQKF